MPQHENKGRFNTRQDKYDAAREILAGGLDHVTQDPEILAAYLRFRAHFRRFSVREEAITCEGYCSHTRRIIGIRSSLSVNSKAATLAHELAHAVAHEGRRAELSKEALELQAEGAAYLACVALGLDTTKAALPYLKHYASEAETLEHRLAEIDRIAWQLVDSVEQARERATGSMAIGRLGAAA